MIALCTELKREFDFVIVDSPAGIEAGFRNAIAGADEVVIVTTPEISAVRDADRIVGLVEAHEKGHPRLIINRVRPDMVKRGDMMTKEDVVEILAIELIGLVPDDQAIITTTNRGEVAVMDRNSQAGRAFSNIARRLLGEDVPIQALTSNDNWWDRVIGALGIRRGATR